VLDPMNANLFSISVVVVTNESGNGESHKYIHTYIHTVQFSCFVGGGEGENGLKY
jgi:hypothetical protein